MLLPEQVKTLIEGVTLANTSKSKATAITSSPSSFPPHLKAKARLARHRLIKDGLKPQLESNELHALSISVAATPAEWAAKQALIWNQTKAV